MVCGIKRSRAFMGHILMDGTPTLWLNGHIHVFGRLLLKSFKTFPPYTCFVVGNRERI